MLCILIFISKMNYLTTPTTVDTKHVKCNHFILTETNYHGHLICDDSVVKYQVMQIPPSQFSI